MVNNYIYGVNNASGALSGSTGIIIFDSTGKVKFFSSGGGGGVSSVGAILPITSSGGATPVISTSMATSRILGRTTAGTGVAEEISVGLGLQFSGGELKDTDFDFSINFEVANPYVIILPYNFSIDSVDDPGVITYTITVNALPYTLGTTITALDIVEVTPGAIGWLNLNCTKLS